MTKALEREFFPAIEVDNRVLWVNPNIYLPFNIKSEFRTDLGVFVVNCSEIKPRLHLGFDNIHHRAGYLGEIAIADRNGTVYHDLDLKGVGYVTNPKGRDYLSVYQIRPRGDNDTWGTWRREKLEREIKITEDLICEGVRTYRIAIAIELKEIALPEGKTITVGQAKDLGMMNKDETPVIGLRVYRDRDRIRHKENDLVSSFTRAKKIIEKELGSELTWEQYCLWFAQTLGQNLAKIHKSGYWHGWVSDHNVTRVCEIIDFGYSEGSKKLADLPNSEAQQNKARDYSEARDTLNTFFLQLIRTGLLSISNVLYLKTFDSFQEAYETNTLPF